MIIELELKAAGGFEPTKSDIQKNINALDDALSRKFKGDTNILLIDTKSILIGIQKNLSE
jgi:hypothetical protein